MCTSAYTYRWPECAGVYESTKLYVLTSLRMMSNLSIDREHIYVNTSGYGWYSCREYRFPTSCTWLTSLDLGMHCHFQCPCFTGVYSLVFSTHPAYPQLSGHHCVTRSGDSRVYTPGVGGGDSSVILIVSPTRNCDIGARRVQSAPNGDLTAFWQHLSGHVVDLPPIEINGQPWRALLRLNVSHRIQTVV